MSEKQRWPLQMAKLSSVLVQSYLMNVAERAITVGSVRRGKPDVGDIEILFIPKMQQRDVDMFVKRDFDLAHERINQLRDEGILKPRLNVEGHLAGWGPKNKLALLAENDLPVDLFSTTEMNWWVSLVIRTGGKETNLKLTEGANRLNRTLNAYGCGVTDRKTGIVTQAFSEQDVFELCGCKYLEPHERL